MLGDSFSPKTQTFSLWLTGSVFAFFPAIIFFAFPLGALIAKDKENCKIRFVWWGRCARGNLGLFVFK